MSDLLTQIRLPGLPGGTGLMDRGRLTVEDMIAQYRRHAQRELDWAQKVLAANDADFHVEVIRGPIVQRKVAILQEGRSPSLDELADAVKRQGEELDEDLRILAETPFGWNTPL